MRIGSSSPAGPASRPRSRWRWPARRVKARLDSVWVAEAWGQDAVSVLGHLSAVTERVALGVRVDADPRSHADDAAMTAATLVVHRPAGAVAA